MFSLTSNSLSEQYISALEMNLSDVKNEFENPLPGRCLEASPTFFSHTKSLSLY